MSKNILYILRGLPGSGKSSLTDILVRYYNDKQVKVRSTDQQFVDSNGVYTWDSNKLGWAHAQNEFLAACDMAASTPIVIIDNTNITRKAMKPYLDLARKYGYEVQQIIVGEFTEEAIQRCFARNTHNVPLSSIQKMAKGFQL